MATFSQAVAASKSAEVRFTENGAKAWATSDSTVLDLFGKIGSSRGRDLSGAFSAALAEDEKLAVRSSADQSPVKMTDTGVCMVSGFSPAIMASVLGANPDEFTPYNLMLKTINSERYDF
jgi:hypothetical protein